MEPVTHDFLQQEFIKVKSVIDAQMQDSKEDMSNINKRLDKHENKHEKIDENISQINVNIQKLLSHAENEEKNMPLIAKLLNDKMDRIEEAQDSDRKDIKGNSSKIWWATGAMGAILWFLDKFVR